MKLRYWILGILVFAAIIVSSFASAPSGGSTLSARASGTKALFLTLQSAKLPVERWYHPFSELPSDEAGAQMFLIAPQDLANEEYLVSWVERGNSLILVDGGGTRRLLQRFGFTQTSRPQTPFRTTLRKRSEEIEVPVPTDERLTRALYEVKKLTYPGPTRYPIPTNAVVVTGTSSDPEIIFLPVGKGELWFLPEPNLVSNDLIDKVDNLRFLYQLTVGHSRILFDEFHHGVTAPATPEARQQTNYVVALLAILTTLLAAGALSRAVRFGPAIQVDTAASLPLAAIPTSVGLLHRDLHTYTILAKYLEGWKERAARVLQLDSRSSLDSVFQAFQRRLPPEYGQHLNYVESQTGNLQDGLAQCPLTSTDIAFLENLLTLILEQPT